MNYSLEGVTQQRVVSRPAGCQRCLFPSDERHFLHGSLTLEFLGLESLSAGRNHQGHGGCCSYK